MSLLTIKPFFSTCCLELESKVDLSTSHPLISYILIFFFQEKSALTTSTEVHILWIDRDWLAGDQRISMFYVHKIYIYVQSNTANPSVHLLCRNNKWIELRAPSFFFFLFFNISHLLSLYFRLDSVKFKNLCKGCF